MSDYAWMPFFVADYLADTGHLTTLQHGAYLLLIMHYWQTGKLPQDDRLLAQIARMTEKQWSANRDVLKAFFSRYWRHKRIDAERKRAIAKRENAKNAGRESQRKSRDLRTAVEHPSIRARDLHHTTPISPSGDIDGAKRRPARSRARPQDFSQYLMEELRTLEAQEQANGQDPDPHHRRVETGDPAAEDAGAYPALQAANAKPH